MFSKKMNRREFLKIVVASATATGLSHFRFLNFGGVVPTLAMDDCAPTSGVEDLCEPLENNADTCPEPPEFVIGQDLCIPNETDPADACFHVLPGGTERDYCNIPQDKTDVCDTHTTPGDACDPYTGEGDLCEWTGEAYEVDVCDETSADVCHPGEGSKNPDLCPEPAGGDGDICLPEIGEVDVCSAQSGAPDLCVPEMAPDVCNPPTDPDQPNLVKVSRLRTSPSLSSSTLGVVAALGAVALLRPRKEDDKSLT
jgi:hypothetical protein